MRKKNEKGGKRREEGRKEKGGNSWLRGKVKEEREKIEIKKEEGTSHPRIAHGQRYPMPCLE